MRNDSLADDHPPKPRFTLRVGITGHRSNKLEDRALERIGIDLARVFRAIEQAGNDFLKANAAIYASAPPQFRLISGFAEGADQLGVAVCPSEWLIEAILPFPKDEYLKDFSDSTARNKFVELLGKASSITQLPVLKTQKRDQGYISAGSYTLRQIDLLIAVWDGAPPKPGGTGAMAKEAYEGGIPVVWLSTVSNHAPRLISDFDDKGGPIAPDADCTEGPLLSALKPIFDGPRADRGYSKRSARDALERFYRETWKPRCYFPAYDLLVRIASLQWPRVVIRARAFADRLADWNQFFQAAPHVTNLTEHLRETLLPRFIWADTLAVHFSQLYRSAYVLAYFLSAFAVFISLSTIFAINLDQKAAAASMEFIVIGLIIILIFFGRHLFWHERWLDYRALAEFLRHGRFLAFLSEFGRTYSGAPELNIRTPPWMLWYVRATMRELGLPSATLDSTYQWRVLDATLIDEIKSQIEYHKTNRQTARHIDRLLHNISILCFLITFFVLMMFLIGYADERIFGHLANGGEHPSTTLGYIGLAIKPWMVICTAGLPALGAALTGIRVHADFQSSEQRSEVMVDSLTILKDDYEALMQREGDLGHTAERLIAASRVMSEDLAAWGELYGRKRLALPA